MYLHLMRAVSAIVVIGVSSQATCALINTRDSASFSATGSGFFQYEGNSVPTAAASTPTAGLPGFSASGGILSISNLSGSSTYLIGDTVTFTPSLNSMLLYSIGYTFETRVKVTAAATAGSPIVFDMNVSAGGGGATAKPSFVLGIGANGLYQRTTGSSVSTTYTADLTDGFHTIRLAVEPNSSTGYVYFDGVEVSSTFGSLANLTASSVRFGDDRSSDISTGSLDVDYIRGDYSGAYAPVPEPSSGVLAVLMTAVLWRVRKINPR